MRTNRTSWVRLLLGVALALGLLPALGAAPAAALTRTTVSGWSTEALSLTSPAALRRTVTVLTGGRAVERRVVLQFRPSGSTTWQALASTRSGAGGAATVATDAVPRSGSLRVKVPATRTAAAVATARTPVTVASSEDPTDPPTEPTPGTPTAFEAEVLRLTNELRAQGVTCGDTRYGPKPALTADPRLTLAARDYAHRMGTERFFAHTSPTGDDPGDRMTAAGYAWRGYGENIAAGQTTPASVVDAWRRSEGHCHNMMGGYVHLGVGHAEVTGSPYRHYWVQNFGVPR